MNNSKNPNFMDINAIEELYKQYKQNPENVDESFRFFFQGFDLATSHFPVKATAQAVASADSIPIKEIAVTNLISEYRRRGHLFTKTNPVRTRRQYTPTLDIENFNLSEADLDTAFEAGREIGLGKATLREIVDHLDETYCKSIGVEYRYMTNPERVNWLQNKMESSKNQELLTNDEKLHLLDKLIEASGFEDYMHRKFVGQKRFSLEGSESLIPALDAIISHGAHSDVSEIVIGMAHRGRLTVLGNTMEKPYADILREFNAQNFEEDILYGDVKYHLGYNTSIDYEGREVALTLVPNPSHLESVGPITQGMARALIENEHDMQYNQVLPIVIHGDAAIAGQGVVYESIQFSKLEGYKTGGTIHIVINNQVGFTTNYTEARSSTYSTDVAKVTHSPVFHVNGDDTEAMVYVAKLALEFRQRYNTDVFIDLLSYRKYGHNEGDEPRFTQPKLYDIIAKHKNPRDIYADKLIQEGVITRKAFEQKVDAFHDSLENCYDISTDTTKVAIQPFLEKKYKAIRLPNNDDFRQVADTKITPELFTDLAKRITTLPEGKNFFNKTVRLFAQRAEMIEKDQYDWAMGELMAYASLAKENHSVRLSGQDSERGTFSHRHAEIITEDGEEEYAPLQNLGGEQAAVEVYNSPLIEYAILGFEYGYALSHPEGLTIWEAQFGDFFNGGQIIVDQYISSAKEKWGIKSGLVMYLPHGYEGQGAEHSSGRIERFLTLAANNNMQIVNPTTPANHFHSVRRQLKRNIRVPLISFTPKSLLRHPEATSTMQDFTEGHFMELIDDHEVTNHKDITKIILCSGKIYYELNAARKEKNANHIAIVRVEQLYPFPMDQYKEMRQRYNDDVEVVWVQEEPRNMGAATFVFNTLDSCDLKIVSRPASGVTAEGLTAMHKIHQDQLIAEAMK